MRSCDLSQPAVAHLDAAMGSSRDIWIVGHDDDRMPAPLELAKELEDAAVSSVWSSPVGSSARINRDRWPGRARSPRADAGRPTTATAGARGGRRGRLRAASLPPRCSAPTATRPAASSGSATFSIAVKSRSRWKRWNTKPMACSRRRVRSVSVSSATSTPSSTTAPRVGESSSPTIWSRVLLPEPDGPDNRHELAIVDLQVDVFEGHNFDLADSSRRARHPRAAARAQASRKTSIGSTRVACRAGKRPATRPSTSASTKTNTNRPGPAT